jgi:hypothetical protein
MKKINKKKKIKVMGPTGVVPKKIQEEKNINFK